MFSDKALGLVFQGCQGLFWYAHPKCDLSRENSAVVIFQRKVATAFLSEICSRGYYKSQKAGKSQKKSYQLPHYSCDAYYQADFRLAGRVI